ncbi:LysO family transporter [Intestinimonas butyriciproducens]|uniref:LysO family transporter n=1 Tax=Intestinimonas butyriciproducens TaxID=1297617 RepID=UPI001FAF05AF|nr:LysO family transporter [Intestinimonas butyriciproducens]
MDFSLLLYIGMLALGILVGSRRSVRSRTLPWLGRLQFVALIVLIAILGVEIGADDKVISSLGEIGLSALVITIFALAGSLLAVTLVRRLLGLDRQGRTVSQREARGEEVEEV